MCRYILNASRGKVVDVDATAAALKSGHLAGAYFDVYPSEPKGSVFSPHLHLADQVVAHHHLMCFVLSLTPNVRSSDVPTFVQLMRGMVSRIRTWIFGGSIRRSQKGKKHN